MNTEDIKKIKSLIQSTDINNHYLAIELGINTLGMTVEDLVNLTTLDDVKYEGLKYGFKYYSCPAFGKIVGGYHNKSVTIRNSRSISYYFIKSYLNEKETKD